MYSRYILVFLIVIVGSDWSGSESVREIELVSGWSLSNQNGSISLNNIRLPSGVYSAYCNEDVLQSYNDVNLRWISYHNWTYVKTFTVNKADFESVKFINLTFHGIDTISSIYLNGHLIGSTNNMFVRYSFSIRPYLLIDVNNVLEVAITSPVWAAKELAAKLQNQNITIPPNCPPERYHGECHMNMLRKMQASFAWDWGLAAPSMGIWKTVTLEFYQVAVIRDVDVVVSKNNTHWLMDVRVFVDSGRQEPFHGLLTLYAVELLPSPVTVNFRKPPESQPFSSVIRFMQVIPVADVVLWWPNGYGQQKLYPLHFTLNAWRDGDGPKPRDRTISQKSIRIGFRTIELIQDELADGTSFYFKVNGIPIFMKGTNYIPSHILPELSADQSRINNLLRSAKDAHMNMIRVWGGGIYESDYFYDMADYYGLLIWQDMMFACAMYPTDPEFLESVRVETIQNAKRLARHASVAIFATNNENEVALAQNWYGTELNREHFDDDYRKLYVATVHHELRIIADGSRPEALISSPSNGIKGREDNFISPNPQDPLYGDVHFYEVFKDVWDPDIYPRPRFSSEYGFQSLPSARAWQRVLHKNEKIVDLINHRQHHPLGMLPISNMVIRHLPTPFKDDDMEASIYLSQVAQAMSTKIETELYRSLRDTEHHTMGALYWQLNDVWVAPSWSSIDFYGNWKILHHWAKDFFAPLHIIPLYDSQSKKLNLTLIRDEIGTKILAANVSMNVYLWADLYPKKTITWQAELKPNSATLNKVIPKDQMFDQKLEPANSFVEFVLWRNETVLARNYYFPCPLKLAAGMSDPDLKIEISSKYCVEPKNSYSLVVKVQRPAVFVYIEIIHNDVEQYHISRNGFIQLEPAQMIHVEFRSKKCVELSLENIKVITLNQFMI